MRYKAGRHIGYPTFSRHPYFSIAFRTRLGINKSHTIPEDDWRLWAELA